MRKVLLFAILYQNPAKENRTATDSYISSAESKATMYLDMTRKFALFCFLAHTESFALPAVRGNLHMPIWPV